MSEENGYKLSIEQRLTRVEDKIEAILTNHLPHIQQAVDGVNRKFVFILIALVLLAIEHLPQLASLLKGVL